MTTLTLTQALEQAIAHHQAGRLREAEALYRAILQAAPNHPDAHHNLGVLAVGLGQARAALPHLKAALEANPTVAQYWLSFIHALIEAGEAAAARQVLAQGQARGLQGPQVEALAARLAANPAAYPAGAATRQGEAQNAPPPQTDKPSKVSRTGTAAKNARRAKLGKSAQEWLQRSHRAQQAGKTADALRFAELAVRRDPDLLGGWLQLAALRYERQDLAGSIEALRHCARLEPGNARHWANLGGLLHGTGCLDEALRCSERAVELDPQHGDAWNNLGTVLRTLGRSQEARAAYEKAHVLNPDEPVPLLNLSLVATDLHDLKAALGYSEKALALAPDDPRILTGRAVTLSNADRCEEAVVLLEQALTREASWERRFRYWLMLPWIAQSHDEIRRWRARFGEGIAALLAVPGTIDNPDDAFGDWFRLAYHGEDDRPLMEGVCRLLRTKVPQLNYTAPHVHDWCYPHDRRIRLGVCSHGLRNHPVGKFTSGFLRERDRTRFELFVIHTPDSQHDPLREKINGWADRVVELSGSHAQQLAQIAALELDALFLPNVTEKQHIYYLGCARLAPVQFASWGIACTSGIDTLDYYLSSSLIEPPGAEAHYCERLILLAHLPTYMAVVVAPNESPPRGHWGLAAERPLYFCPQSLFKYHPDFDGVLAEIARLDPNAQIVAIEGMSANWTNRLRERWAKHAPILNERVMFLPRQEHNAYMALVAQADVLLDTVHFGSGTTFYEAMYYGTPVVTWPGRFMRGRIVAGGYRQMGLTDAPVAERLEDYARVAVEWANDPARRAAFRQQALAAREKLFADLTAVRQFEAFIEAALTAAARGEKLPSGWRIGQNALPSAPTSAQAS